MTIKSPAPPALPEGAHLRKALEHIVSIELGPDRGTAQWQIDCAIAIAKKALAAAPPAPSPAARGEEDSFDFIAYQQSQIRWSERTFGPGSRSKGIIDHIRKELAEIEANPDDISEWIDVAILALDGAWRAGYSATKIAEALLAKQRKNFARVWPDWRTMSEDHAIEHDRSGEAASRPAPAARGEELRAAAERVCWYDWSDNDRDAVQAIEALRKALASRPAPQAQIAEMTRLKDRIDHRLNNHLCEMKEGYDDSITGFNEAWTIVSRAFGEATATEQPPPQAQIPVDRIERTPFRYEDDHAPQAQVSEEMVERFRKVAREYEHKSGADWLRLALEAALAVPARRVLTREEIMALIDRHYTSLMISRENTTSMLAYDILALINGEREPKP
jgi:hypothetical protein